MRNVIAFGFLIFIIVAFKFLSSLHSLREESIPRQEIISYFDTLNPTDDDLGLLQSLLEIPGSDTTEIRIFLSENYSDVRRVLQRSLHQMVLHSISDTTEVSLKQLTLTRRAAQRLARFRFEPVHKDRISFLSHLSDKDKWRLLEAEYLLSQAISSRKKAEFTNSQTLFDKTRRFYHQLGDEVGLMNALYFNGLLHYQIDDFSSSVRIFEAVRRLAQEHGDIYLEIRALHWLGVNYKELRNFDAATEVVRAELELAEKIGDELFEAKARSTLASIYEATGATFWASEMLTEMLEIYRAHDSERDIALVYRRLGFVFQDFGDYERALDYQLKSLYTFKKIDDLESEMSQYNNIGITKAEMGDLTGARTALQTAIAMAATHRYPGQLAIFHINLGKIYSEFGDFEKARYHLDLAFEHGDEVNKSDFHMITGDILLQQKKWRQAKRNLMNAVVGFRQSDYKIGLINSLLGLGEAQLSLRENDNALKHFNEAISQSIASNYLSLLWRGYYGKARVLDYNDDDAEAIKNYTYAVDIIEQERDRLSGLQTRLELFAKRQQVYDAAILCYFEDMQDEEKALEFTERAKARAFLDMIQGAVRINQTDEASDSKWSAEILSREIQVTDLDKIRGVLQADELIVEYRVLQDRLLIWLIENNSVTAKQVFIGRERLQNVVEDFRQALGADTPGETLDNLTVRPEEIFQETKAAALKVSKYLLEPVWHEFKNRSMIYVVPDDVLHYVPFAALMQPDAPSRFLIELAPLATGPSASVIYHTATKDFSASTSQDVSVLAVADPDGELKGSRKTAQYIAAKYPETRLLLGPNATKDSVLQCFEKPFGHMYFGVHVTVDERAPLQTAMHLFDPDQADGSDGHDLKVYELLNSRLLRTKAVTLSGCQTAMGRFYRGEGFVGLTRAFMSVGVPTVMVTLWEIDDKATDKLMRHFYDNLDLEHGNFARALRQAQLTRMDNLRRDSVFKFAHPFLWAAFANVGKAY